MKKKRLGSMRRVALALIMALLFTQFAAAKDISGSFDNDTPVETGKLITANFETKHDSDCYSFISGGGAYTLTVYSKYAINELGWEFDPEIMDESDRYYGWAMNGLEVLYASYDYFSSAAGDEPRYQVGSIHSLESPFVDEKTSDGWYKTTIDLSKFKKGKKVAIRFDAFKKGAYKFQINGKPALNPGATTAKKVTKAKKGFTIKWAKANRASGYEIKYATNSKFKKAKTVKAGKSATKKKIKSLKSKKRYFVKVRAYRNVNGKRYFGAWSDTMKVKTK